MVIYMVFANNGRKLTVVLSLCICNNTIKKTFFTLANIMSGFGTWVLEETATESKVLGNFNAHIDSELCF